MEKLKRGCGGGRGGHGEGDAAEGVPLINRKPW